MLPGRRSLVLSVDVAARKSQAQNVPALFNVPFNLTHHFGYDGPWQAIPILVSDPPQLVNLYPGGTYATCIPSTNVRNYAGSYTSDNFPLDAGLYDLALATPDVYGSSQNFGIAGPEQGGTIGVVDGSLNGGQAASLNGQGLVVTDTLSFANGLASVKNVSISAIYNATYDLPNGTSYPLDTGFFSLGASNDQFFGQYVGNMVPLNLSATGIIPSNTYSLHIGSVQPSIPGSLILGGYDRNRVIGGVSTWTGQGELFGMIINLLDVSIGVARGGSPFPFTSKSGLLIDDGRTVSSLTIRPNPTLPYLYLPGDTCKAIASYLPITYIESLDLYSWDTSTLTYQNIVTSPSYLQFTFQTNDASGNMTVKVPFALLNLTLTAPLVDTSTQYFPCKSYVPPGQNSEPGNEYHLGRAFLQAAFIGMNWYNHVWWMAQAPGPSRLAPYTVALDNGTTTIETAGDASMWLDSWSGILAPLPNQDSTATSVPGSGLADNTGFSTGAEAGIGIGAGLGGLVLLGIIAFLVRRTRKSKPKTSAPVSNDVAGTSATHHSSPYAGGPRNDWERHELEAKSIVSGQMSSNSPSLLQRKVLELSADQINRLDDHQQPSALSGTTPRNSDMLSVST